MAKTRSQTAVVSIKKENFEDTTHLLNNVSSTTRKRSKITKRSPPTCKNSTLPVRDVKLEEGSDNKPMLKPVRKTIAAGVPTTKEQVDEFIDCVFNKKMAVKAAARKVKMGSSTGFKYYYRYKSDPTKDPFIPLHAQNPYTYEEIKKVIGYIVDDGMHIREASRAAKMSYCATYSYYKRYLEDPNHKIPLPRNQEKIRNSVSTQEQIKTLIQCMVHDNVSLDAAAVKANMGKNSAKRYYRKYLEDPDHKIPVPPKMGHANQPCTHEQVEKLIHYIVDDKMTIENAAIKANMSERTGGKYYHRYLNDPNRKIPSVKGRPTGAPKVFTQEQIIQVIGFITNDKMSINAAAVKADMSEGAVKRYYDQYLNDPDHNIPAPRKSIRGCVKRFTQKQISDLIRYLVNDNMYLPEAAAKVDMSVGTAKKYYTRYLHDPKHKIPKPFNSYGTRYTQEKVDELIGYIVSDKLSIPAASYKAGMGEPTARKYYARYLDVKKEMEDL